MTTVVLPGSLIALFPGTARRHAVIGSTVTAVLTELDARIPGLRERLVEAGPRLRPHINVYVDGRPADLTTEVPDGATVHVIPAVSGGAGRQVVRTPA
jgi:molybdopterin converting factor small subunit